MIIYVDYRVNSKRGVKFRQWANNVLKQYLIKGYAVNERMRKEQIGELRQLVGMLGRRPIQQLMFIQTPKAVKGEGQYKGQVNQNGLKALHEIWTKRIN